MDAVECTGDRDGLPWYVIACMFYPLIALLTYILLGVCGRVSHVWGRMKTFMFLVKCLWKRTGEVTNDVNKGPAVARIEGKYIVIPYTFNGKDYNAYLPYSRKFLMKTSGATVALHSGDRSIDITQMPGVAYVMSVVDMDGDYFECNISGVKHIRRTPLGFLDTIH